MLIGAGCVAFVAGGMPLFWPALIMVPGLAYLTVIAWRPALLARLDLLAPLFEAGLRGHLVAMAASVPYLLALFLGIWLPIRFFGVDMPLASALALLPKLMLLRIRGLWDGPRDDPLLSMAGARAIFESLYPGSNLPWDRALAGAASWGIAVALIDALLSLVLLLPALSALSALKGAPSAAPSAGATVGRRTNIQAPESEKSTRPST
jgi:hypothetical protein